MASDSAHVEPGVPGVLGGVVSSLLITSRSGRLFLALILVGAAAGFRSVARVQQTPVFRSELSVVMVDVLVRDRDGKPVHGLVASDFEIYDRGRRQSVVNFAEISRQLPEPQPLPRGAGVPLTDVATNSALERTGRAFVFIVDPTIEIELYRRVMTGLFELVTPDDLAAVVFPHRSDLSEDFTSDPARLARTLDRLKEAASTGGGLKYTLDGIENATLALEPLPRFRKVIVWISSGYDVKLVPDTRSKSLETIDHKPLAVRRGMSLDSFYMFEKAVRAGIPVYAIDPTGLHERPGDNSEFLKTTALVTGGLSYVNRPNIVEATRELMTDNSHFYVLGFAPDPLVTDGKFREIEVRLPRHREVDVRSREGYIAKRPPPPPPNPVAAMTRELAAGTSRTDLGVWAFAAPLTGGVRNRAKVALTLVVRYPEADPAGRREEDELRVQVLTLDPDARVRGTSERRLRVPAAMQSSPGGVVLNEVFELPQGPAVFRVGAMSRLTGGSGTLSLSLDVPMYSATRPGLTQLILGVPGQPPGVQFDLVAGLMPFQATVQRRFRPGSMLQVFSRVFGLSRSRPGTTPKLTISGDAGVIREFQVSMTPSASGLSSSHDIAAEVLLEGLPAGTYVLTLTITPPNQNQKPFVRSVQIHLDS